MLYLLIIVAFAAGVGLGKYDQKLKQEIKGLHDKMDKQEVGPTQGSYGNVNSLTMTPTATGAVRPKTPEQLEWEEAERLREAQLKVPR